MYRNYIKRWFDFLVALVAIVIALPVLIIVIIVLFFANKGAVFFIQQRPGKNGRLFNIVKFKTMHDQRDKSGKLLPDTQRLTLPGRFIRASSLDELPQLFSVLTGNMSLIGPRPLLPKYLPLYNAQQQRRHEVRPGITGWAQVNGRNAISWTKKFEYDVWYVDNVNFWLDVKIIWLTIKKVLVREGINADSRTTMQPFTGNN